MAFNGALHDSLSGQGLVPRVSFDSGRAEQNHSRKFERLPPSLHLFDDLIRGGLIMSGMELTSCVHFSAVTTTWGR